MRYSELLKLCSDVGIIHFSMGESCPGKSCLFLRTQANSAFWSNLLCLFEFIF